MKNIGILILLVAALGCGEDKSSYKNHNSHEQKETQKVYTCPMHPEIIRNEPGQCPICGMKLVEKINTGEKVKNDGLDILLKPVNEVVLSNVGTVFPKQKELSIEQEVSGIVTYDTKQISSISARVSGRIEKLFVKYRYQQIVKGQKLMEIYSKELVTEQENFIYLLKNDSENKTLIDAAENRLLLLGLTAGQVNELRNSNKAFQSLVIYSPYSGHLHDLSPKSSDTMMQNKTAQELTVKEGMYVQKGQTIFNIYNTEKVWALLNLFPDMQNEIKTGSNAILSVSGVEENIEAKIDFIEPVIREGLQTVSARVSIDNKNGEIKIGSLVNARIISENKKGLVIPSTAIINLGTTDIIFVKDGNIFRSKEVKRGKTFGDEMEIISGLTESEEIALNAQMLVDSESFIRTNE